MTQVVSARSACAGIVTSRNGGDAALNANSARRTGSSMRSGRSASFAAWRLRPCSVACRLAARQSVSSSTIGPDQSRNVSAGPCVPMPCTKTMPVRRAIGPDGGARPPDPACARRGGRVPGPCGPLRPRRPSAGRPAGAPCRRLSIGLALLRLPCGHVPRCDGVPRGGARRLGAVRGARRPHRRAARASRIDAAHGWSGRDLMAHMLAWQGTSLDAAKELASTRRAPCSPGSDADWEARGGDVVNDGDHADVGGQADGRAA